MYRVGIPLAALEFSAHSFLIEGTAPNGQSVKLLYTIQFENINIISTHITSPSWYEVDVAVRVVAPLDCSSSVSSDGGEGCAED